MSSKKIQSALISVYHKDNLDVIVKKLDALGVRIYSTGGTEEFIKGLGIDVVPVENVTDYPSILGGRVKTLHPKIFGGILYRRENNTDIAQVEEYEIPSIDLVIVDLYPFESTVASGAEEQAIIEKIDIGGISLIRAAAKNFKDVVIVASQNQYALLNDLIDAKQGETSVEDRKLFAAHAFQVSSHYDSAIFNYFNTSAQIPALKISESTSKVLRYGENPHQGGTFYGKLDDMFEQMNGKELSYNNLVDIDAAVNLIDEFTEAPTIAILKHNNACGIASASTIYQAYQDAFACDPVSAFGGVIISNKGIDLKTAEAMHSLFFEVLIAPSFDVDAKELLIQKKNRILLLRKETTLPASLVKTLLNGFIEQDKDLKTETAQDLKVVTKVQPSQADINDLLFAAKVCKHTKSNTIVLAKNNKLISSGVGQTSRVDALKQAIEKAAQFGFDVQGAVMASDAFFPFPDCVEIAHLAGINCVIQPGGSIKDQESINYCDNNGMSMVFTGLRHFKH